MTSLTHRIAVVTGASSGIGADTVRALSAEGARVAALGRREDRLKELDALPIGVDVRDRAAVRAAADRVRAELGRPDLVVANAGVMLGAPFEEADVAEWDTMLDTNLAGLLHTARAFIDDLIAAAAAGRPADLVLVGSVAGHQPFASYGVYCATKAAVAHLARSLRLELGPRGVRVRNVEPGVVATELGDGMLDESAKDQLSQWRASLGALRGEDIAAGVAWSAAAPARVNVAEMIIVPTTQG